MDWGPPTRQAPSRQAPQGETGSDSPPILVIGLGNPILGDDGVGWRVADKVRLALDQGDLPQAEAQAIEIDSLALGGLSLMERLIDYDRIIIIDALTTQENPPGTVYSFPLEQLPDRSTGHTTAAHDTSLRTALKVGRSMGVHLPEQIVVVGVEAEITYDFSEELTPPIEAAIPEVVQVVMDLLSEWSKQTE